MEPQKKNAYSKNTFLVLFILVIFLNFKIFASSLMAIIVGGLFALALIPLQKKIISNNVGARSAAYLVFFFFVIAVITPIALFIRALIVQAISIKNYITADNSFIKAIPLNNIIEKIHHLPLVSYFISNPSEFENEIRNLFTQAGTLISSSAIKVAAQIPDLLIQTLLILFSCLFFLLDGEKFMRFLTPTIPLRDEIKLSLIDTFKESSRSALLSTFMASLAQTLTIFVAFLILSLPAPFLAAGTTFICSFIPVIGSTIIWVLAGIYLLIKGSYVKLVFMIIFGIITAFIDNIVRAYTLKNAKEGLHPLIGIVSVLGGIEVFGLFGVLIGPMLATLLITMCKVWPQVLKE